MRVVERAIGMVEQSAVVVDNTAVEGKMFRGQDMISLAQSKEPHEYAAVVANIWHLPVVALMSAHSSWWAVGWPYMPWGGPS